MNADETLAAAIRDLDAQWRERYDQVVSERDAAIIDRDACFQLAERDVAKIKADIEALTVVNLRHVRHLKHLASWAAQDATGPVPYYQGMPVQKWVLNEIHLALVGEPES